jgi:hypothetical protein
MSRRGLTSVCLIVVRADPSLFRGVPIHSLPKCAYANPLRAHRLHARAVA